MAACPIPQAVATTMTSTISEARHDPRRRGEDHTTGWPWIGGVAGSRGPRLGRSTVVPQKEQTPWSPCIAIEAPQEGQ